MKIATLQVGKMTQMHRLIYRIIREMTQLQSEIM